MATRITDHDEEQEGPAKKKKKRKKKTAGSPKLWYIIGSVAAVVVFLGVGVTVLVIAKPWNAVERKKAEAAQNVPEPEKPGKIGGEVVREPKTLLGNIRRRPELLARDAEMLGIVTLFDTYCDEVKNPTNRSLDGFLESIRRENAKTVMGVKNKDYIVNVKARPRTEEIVVYESEKYTQGYYCVRGNRATGFVSAEDLKTAGLDAP
jgi:hypothetical protein